MKKQYRVELIYEGALGTMLFGSSKIPKEQIEEVLNRYGEDGWNMDFMLIEKRRLMLFWQREVVIITLSKEK